MLRRDLPVIALLALAPLGCEPGDPQLDVAVTLSPLIAPTAVRAIVVLYPASPPTSCEVLRLSEQGEAVPKRGIGSSEVRLDGAAPHDTEFFDLVPGNYQIAVFVYDIANVLVGFGCRPESVSIELGNRTEAPLIEVRAITKT